ncbi:MAG: hypothetical protein GX573_15475 [Chloroflexi bacterium]|nr:hypothetical protein [Chloroflexota bacterium]HLV37457.1 hypothetical protein [Spirillospora sp.]
MFALKPDFSVATGPFALTQRAAIFGFTVSDVTEISPVLKHVAHHLLANRLFARAQFPDHRLLVHPLGDF